MKIDGISFEGFEKRTSELQKIFRYNQYDIVFYRSDVWTHSKRLYYLLKSLKDRLETFYLGNIDYEKILIMALVHDDAEIVIGDFPRAKKEKLTSKQKLELKRKEVTAIYDLCMNLPLEIGGYNYQALLLEVLEKNTIESQLVKYLDRLDGYCEALHEIIGGNKVFILDLESEFGILEIPPIIYQNMFNNYEKTYPLLKDLIEEENLPFMKFKQLDISLLFENSIEFNEENILVKKGVDFYDWWIEVLSKNLEKKDFQKLYEKRE